MLTKTKIGCLNTDRVLIKGEILEEIPAPRINGRYYFHVSRFLMANGSTTDVVHVKPVYYHTKEKETRPLEEICSWAGNRKIVLKRNPFDLDINFGYLSWLMKRQSLLGGVLKWDGLPGYIALNATGTFYPDPDPESSTVDGVVKHVDAGGLAWATLVGAAGTAATDDDATPYLGYRPDSGNDPNWDFIFRFICLFDTSGIGADPNISAATLSIWGRGVDDVTDNSPALNVYSSNPALNTALAAGDYDSLGTTIFSDTAIALGSWSNGSYNVFTLNGDGRTAIDKEGITKLGLRESVYDAGSGTPTWIETSGNSENFHFYAAEQTGTDNDPKLIVTFNTVYSITVSDTISLADVTTPQSVFNKTLTDVISIVDSVPSVIRGFVVSVIDRISISDIVTAVERGWISLVKSVTSWTKKPKNTTNCTKQSKNTTDWTNQNKS